MFMYNIMVLENGTWKRYAMVYEKYQADNIMRALKSKGTYHAIYIETKEV